MLLLVLAAVIPCALFFMIRTEAPARSQDAPRLWAATAIGASVPWPADFSTSRVASKPAYSPSGNYLAFTDQSGKPLILDLSARSLRDLYDSEGQSLPHQGCVALAWLSEQRLYLFERWVAHEELAGWQPDQPPPGGSRYRVVDWRTPATVLERTITPQSTRFDFVAAETEDTWIVRNLSEPDWRRRLWLYNVTSDSFVRVLAECSETENLAYAPRGPWVVTLLAPRSVNPQAWPVSIEFANYRTGATVRVQDVPPLPSWGPRITADGRYVFTATLSDTRDRWIPVVFDVQSGARRDLPSTESWIPAALSEPRGVLLAALYSANADETFTENYAEIPLERLIHP